MDFSKLPRWALIWGFLATMSISGFFMSRAIADMDKVKGVAYQAKDTSESNAKDIGDLKDSVKEVRSAQETFRREYREDQKDLDKKLGELLIAIKK